MTRVDAVEALADFDILTLECGHKAQTTATAAIGQQWDCSQCRAERLERRNGVQPATSAQLDAIAADYAATMRALGHDVPDANMPVLRRAAAIQDAWRMAFGKVLS